MPLSRVTHLAVALAAVTLLTGCDGSEPLGPKVARAHAQFLT